MKKFKVIYSRGGVLDGWVSDRDTPLKARRDFRSWYSRTFPDSGLVPAKIVYVIEVRDD